MKIRDKGFDNDPRIDRFTVGRDRELDLLLAPYDIEGTMHGPHPNAVRSGTVGKR